MTRGLLRLPREGRPFLELLSRGRPGPSRSSGFSGAQIELIRRTVQHTPEVMVKVTGGGKRAGAVAAHLSYISQKGELELETDDGEHVSRGGQKALLGDWHLELTAGQYRGPRGTRAFVRPVKLVHNVVLSMPKPTPPEKVLAAAKVFAREKFGAHPQLEETRERVVAGWMNVPGTLDAQGELSLAGDVRGFASKLLPVLTDRERLAARFVRYVNDRIAARTPETDKARIRELERTR